MIVGVASAVDTAAPPIIDMPGATVSIVNDWEAEPTLPAGSVMDTATGWRPSANASQPSPTTSRCLARGRGRNAGHADDTATPGSVEVPLIVGDGSFVNALAPPVMATTGAAVSTVNDCVALPGFPASSTTDATTGRVPSESDVGVTFQVPDAWTIVVRVCPATVTVTNVPGRRSDVPAIVGVESFVNCAAPPMMVTTGKTVSIVRDWVSRADVARSVDDRWLLPGRCRWP